MYSPLGEEDRMHNRRITTKVFGQAQQLKSIQSCE